MIGFITDISWKDTLIKIEKGTFFPRLCAMIYLPRKPNVQKLHAKGNIFYDVTEMM